MNLTIRKLDPEEDKRLRVRAARHGRSVQEEAFLILSEALREAPSAMDGFDRLRRHFASIEGVDLEPPHRQPGREPPHMA